MLWLKGLVAAIIGGVAGSVALLIVDPLTYNIQAGWPKLLQVMLVMAIVSAGMYLKQSPLPNGGAIPK